MPAIALALGSIGIVAPVGVAATPAGIARMAEA